MSKSKPKLTKRKVCLDGSEHREVILALYPADKHTDYYGRSVNLTFQSDGMNVELFMMERDARTLAEFLLKHTQDWGDSNARY